VPYHALGFAPGLAPGVQSVKISPKLSSFPAIGQTFRIGSRVGGPGFTRDHRASRTGSESGGEQLWLII